MKKQTKLGILIFVIIVLIPVGIGLVYHIENFVLPTFKVHSDFRQLSGTPWRTVAQIRAAGLGNCSDLTFVLMDDLKAEHSIFLVTEKGGRLHAAAMVGNVVMDPTIPSVGLYKNYMRGRTLVDMIPKSRVNAYVHMEVFAK